MNHPLEKQLFEDSVTYFGFWLYLMTDFVLFASLFAVFAVLRPNTFGGPGSELFSMRFVLSETLLLLLSSFTAGLALLAAARSHARQVVWWLGITFVLGALFLSMEVTEFMRLALSGAGPSRSAFLSSYFTLVGTHGLHVALGAVWLIVLASAIYRHGLTRGNTRKLVLWSMFWHFLDLVWICIFTIVYLFGLL